jgi:predicted aldo/keto reductase-like oxidoreductase
MGKTGVKSSILGFGCMRLPLNGPKFSDIDFDLATQMLHKAIDAGVNYVDSAYPYHNSGDRATHGESENFLRDALKNGYREKVKVATKLPTWLVESHRDMHRFLDEQLKYLDLRKIDFYLAHNLNSGNWGPLQENKLFKFFEEAMKDGRIDFPCFSFHDESSLFETIIKSYDWALCLVQYNYLDQQYQAGRSGVRLAAERGTAVAVMEPLRGGYLTRHVPPEPKGWLNEAHPDWSLAAWALNWLWNQPEVSVVLSGMSAMDQVEDNLKTAERYAPGIFGEAEEELVRRVVEYFASRAQVNCTGCGYCLPCPSGVNIPKNLEFLNQFYLFDADEARDRCLNMYDLTVPLAERAKHCTSCSECEEKCPQHIPIPEILEKTLSIFANSNA